VSRYSSRFAVHGAFTVRIAFALLAGLLSLAVQAAPADFVSFDRSLWPEQLNSPALFDVASRAEILSFARVLESEMLDEQALAARLGLRQVNLQKIRALRARMWQRLWSNYQQAQQSCEQDASFCYPLESMADLRMKSATFAAEVGKFYAGWIEPSHQFHTRYLDELLRKAALFPQTSSEVELSARERNGDELNDRMFLLTFVGGPGPAGGNTDGLADYLRRQKLDGIFFVLGNRLQQRRDSGALAGLYAASAWASRAGSTAPMPSGRTGRTRCGAARRGFRRTCRRNMCRCSARPTGSARGWRGVHGQPAVAGVVVGYRCPG
jgi:hypothetical protein